MGLASLCIYLLIKANDFAFAIAVFTIVASLTDAIFPLMMLSLACFGRRLENDEKEGWRCIGDHFMYELHHIPVLKV